MITETDIVYLFTDGSSDKNRFGGWAYAITSGIREEDCLIADMCMPCTDTTNNRMELQAVIEAIECAHRLYFRPKNLIIFSDSAYVINCFNDRWYRTWIQNNWINSSGQTIANLDLWKRLLILVNNLTGQGYSFTWNHVKGHTDCYWNIRCDTLAGGARKMAVRGSL